jgi:hypothetical protein
MSFQYLQQQEEQGVNEYTYEFRKKNIRLGVSLDELGVVVKYLGGIFSHI